MSDSNKKYPVVVLGIGNILWADEGFGVRAVEAFNEAWKCPEDVLVLDGGTLGFYLSEYIESCSKIIIFDACEFNELPGTCKVLKKEDINPWLNTKMSAHQEGLNDLFAVAKLLGRYPDEIVVLGCQPGDLEDYGGSLTPEVSAAVPGMVEEAAKQLKEWGFKIEPRTPDEKAETLGESCLERKPYEEGRPSEEEACRYADLRYFVKRDQNGNPISEKE